MQFDNNFASTGSSVPPIGLGCSRLGSVLGASRDESVTLIEAALNGGIRFFDTSDIYAQGDSERILGDVIGNRSDVLVCTKVGKYLPPLKKLILPLKAVIRRAAMGSYTVRQGVRQSRSKPMPANWSNAYISLAIDRSLKRLKRDRIDVLMLHSPPLRELVKGGALAALVKARQDGKIGLIGISVDDPDTALAALNHDEVAVLQMPLHPGDIAFDVALTKASQLNVAVVAREVLGGPNVIGQQMLQREMVQRRMREVTAATEVTLALLGTTKIAHLNEAIGALGR